MILTQEELKRQLHYDQFTGIFTWLVANSNRVNIGDTAGCVGGSRGKTYIIIQINHKAYKAHRLAFLYVKGKFPDKEGDHINGNGLNNIWSNLRDVTHTENGKNRRLSRSNTSGYTGLHWNRMEKRWKVHIGVNGKRIHLGSFANKQEAIKTRQKANIEYGFHENHGSIRPL